MTEEDIEEFRLKEHAIKYMTEQRTDWVAMPTNYDAKKNLSLAKNIVAWYGMSALPCTDIAIQKSGAQLTIPEYRECIPRPESSQGLVIARPKHVLMRLYLKIWVGSDDKRIRTRRAEVLRYIEYGVISADHATMILEFESKDEDY